MTGQERDYEAVLSRVLHTTVDQLEPVGDGLTKIRDRLSEPWLKRQWWLLRSELMVLRWFVVVRFEAFVSTVRSRSGVTDLDADANAARGTAQDASDGGPLRSLLSMATLTPAKRPRSSVGPAMAWLRPALAVAGAVVLVVAGVFALGQIRSGLFLGLENATSSTSNTGNGTGPGSPQGGGSPVGGSGTSPQGNSGTASPGTSAARSRAATSASPCAAPSPPPVNSPTPTPTSASPSPTPTSASPTPTPTSASPTPTPTSSGAPVTSGIAPQTQEAIGTTALVRVCEPTAPASPSNQATATP